MAFNGPDNTDYDNVASLNQAFLTLLGKDPGLRRSLEEIPADLASRLTALNSEQITRLAGAPFLLFSFRESDDGYWGDLLSDSQEGDLFRIEVSAAVDTLTSAGLGFIWQLAQRNPYALRLICGAPLSWCEQVAEITFYRLLAAVRQSGSPPGLRASSEPAVWRKLLSEGLGRKGDIRRAAHVSVLQAILTAPAAGQQPHWSLAARRLNTPAKRVADRRG